jgi:hypothetical protein
MRKSMWIEVVEWCVFAMVAVLVSGVVVMRAELTTSEPENPAAPIHSIDE